MNELSKLLQQSLQSLAQQNDAQYVALQSQIEQLAQLQAVQAEQIAHLASLSEVSQYAERKYEKTINMQENQTICMNCKNCVFRQTRTHNQQIKNHVLCTVYELDSSNEVTFCTHFAQVN